MLSATEISSALKQSLADAEALCVVSLMQTSGRPTTRFAPLLVKEGGADARASLGNLALEAVAARRAVALMKDGRQEIVVASLSELGESVASPSSGIGAECGTRIGDTRLLFEISRPPLELIIC